MNKYRRFAILAGRDARPRRVPGQRRGRQSGGDSSGGAAADNLLRRESSGDDLLATICEQGRSLISTDPAYPPQSFLTPDGTYEGFDIDVANEIAERLGVEVEFVTPTLDLVRPAAGRPLGHQRRLDDDHRRRAGHPRLHAAVLLHAGPDGGDDRVGHHDLDGLAGKTVCVGEATTYCTGSTATSTLGDGSRAAPAPKA